MNRQPYPCRITKPSGKVVADFSFPKKFANPTFRPRLDICRSCKTYYMKDKPGFLRCKPCRIVNKKRIRDESYLRMSVIKGTILPRKEKCLRCKKSFMKRTVAQKRCKPCAPKHARERDLIYRRKEANAKREFKPCKASGCSTPVATWNTVTRAKGICKPCSGYLRLKRLLLREAPL